MRQIHGVSAVSAMLYTQNPLEQPESLDDEDSGSPTETTPHLESTTETTIPSTTTAPLQQQCVIHDDEDDKKGEAQQGGGIEGDGQVAGTKRQEAGTQNRREQQEAHDNEDGAVEGISGDREKGEAQRRGGISDYEHARQHNIDNNQAAMRHIFTDISLLPPSTNPSEPIKKPQSPCDDPAYMPCEAHDSDSAHSDSDTPPNDRTLRPRKPPDSIPDTTEADQGDNNQSDHEGDDDQSDQEAQFIVEDIFSQKVQKNVDGSPMRCQVVPCVSCGLEPGKLEFEVKWQDHDTTHNTWEPRQHLMFQPEGNSQPEPFPVLKKWETHRGKAIKKLYIR